MIIWSKLISEAKCIDGLCRKDCKILSSACSHDKPIRCGDGRCVTLMAECASIRCPTDTPYRCGDGKCAMNLKLCEYFYSIRVIKGDNIQTPDDLLITRLKDQQRRIVGQIETMEQLNLIYKAVPLSQIANTTINVRPDHQIVYHYFFSKDVIDVPPVQFIRSVVLQITTNSDEESNSFNAPVMLELKFYKTYGGAMFDSYDSSVS